MARLAPQDPATASAAIELAGDADAPVLARFWACKIIGRLKVKSAAATLDGVLKSRPELALVQAAAWALQEINGKAPSVPQAKAMPGKDWIIQTKD